MGHKLQTVRAQENNKRQPLITNAESLYAGYAVLAYADTEKCFYMSTVSKYCILYMYALSAYSINWFLDWKNLASPIDGTAHQAHGVETQRWCDIASHRRLNVTLCYGYVPAGWHRLIKFTV